MILFLQLYFIFFKLDNSNKLTIATHVAPSIATTTVVLESTEPSKERDYKRDDANQFKCTIINGLMPK